MQATWDDYKLTITVDEEERAELREMAEDVQSDGAMWDFLEPLIANTELDWADASETGDLTDAPILAIRDDDGRVMERWAFMTYELRSPLEDLRVNGVAVFISGK